MNKVFFGISVVALFALTIVMSGCKKNKDKKTVAIVTVVDEDGAVVAGASVPSLQHGHRMLLRAQ